ncbi:MAG: CRISPR-associated endonuclease Cas1 [Candidatus Methylomirabilis sp.]|nr:CRISPR-associated endonuclease Cas1 [Deltaproteobacteria bacterium]
MAQQEEVVNMDESGLRATDAPPEDAPVMGVRYLHNYVYCPRLFYYQWVENIFVESADTVAGGSKHRQVDKPSRVDGREGFEAPEGATLRSLRLESGSLGLAGVIDIIEGGQEGCQIIDYKRGSARRDESGELIPKDPDAVQVAAYTLLAREHGLHVSGAAIYYAGDRRRVPVTLSEDALARVPRLVQEARAVAASTVCPPPLENDARCQYCSAYPVCLPGESLYWSGSCEEPKLAHPPVVDGDEGEVIVAQDARAFLSKKGDQLHVALDGNVISKHPLRQVRAVYLFGAVQMSAQLVHACLDEGKDVAYFAPSGRFLGLLRGLPASGIDARIGQYRLFQDENTCLTLAKEVVRAKIHNQRVLLMRNGNVSDQAIEELRSLRDRTLDARDIGTVLGLEGRAAAVYFEGFSSMLKENKLSDFSFSERNKRPPKDPVNALLSLAYSMLAKELTGVCHSVGLDPFLGFYHKPRYGRPALALDLMEEFRPLTADSIVLSLINRGEVAPSDFLFSSHGCNLNEHGRRAFWQGWFRRLNDEVTHPVFRYRMSYRRMFEVQARQLWRFLRGEAKTYTGFTTR